MSLKKKWRVRCTTDDVHKYVVQDSIDPQPTECPDDNSHTIDSNATVVIAEGNDEIYHLTRALNSSAVIVTEDTTWQTIASFVADVNSVISDLSKVVSKVSGLVITNGTGLQIRIMENGITQANTVLYEHGDSVGASQPFVFSTDVEPSTGGAVYSLEARLNGATSGTIVTSGISLIENVNL